MNELQIFENKEFGEIRTIVVNDKPYFCASDVAKALGYAKPNNAISTHCKSTLKQGIATKQGNMSEMIFIPEGDVYRLIMRSKLPGAERFESWVMDEVLPSIWKHGGYIAGQEHLSDEDLLAKALLVATNKIKEKEQRIKSLEDDNERMKPKEIFTDAVTASDSSILIRELAKLIRQNGVDMGERRLYKWLREAGYICKNSTEPTQRAMELGLFERVVRTIQRGDGLPLEKSTTKVTGKGQVYFINKFLNHCG